MAVSNIRLAHPAASLVSIEKQRRERAQKNIVHYIVDHRAFTRFSQEIIKTVLPGVVIEDRDIMGQLRMAIKGVQELLRKRQKRSAARTKAQALKDLMGFKELCVMFLNDVVKSKRIQIKIEELEDTIESRLEDLLVNIIKVLECSKSHRPALLRAAIVRLRSVANVARFIYETTTQTEGMMRDELKSIGTQELLEAVAERENIPAADKAAACQAAMLAFAKAKAYSLKSDDADRPKWISRSSELKKLTAPKFLKMVYADLIKSDGVIVDEERIRRHDAKLVQVVQQYILKRIERGQDLGDAAGISFANKGWRGPARRPSVDKQPHPFGGSCSLR